ncbi:MAG: (2Fe-2S)-binding protein [Deltaproteobacteria bacterium]|nr:(2Fe-2S)-binding protein [Deltaproteobacteria bacterium]
MEKIKFVIDGKEVEAIRDQCVLDVARQNGIYIPGLCYNPEVKFSGGSCRLCLVEAHQAGRMSLVTACNYPIREGLEIKTDTSLVKRIRKGIIELLLARVPDSDVIKELAAEAGIDEPRFVKDEGENYHSKCIACGLCIQVCEEVVGVSAIAMLNRGPDKTPGTPYKKPSEVCIGCGACAYACPTDAIPMEDNGDTRKIWGREFKMHLCSVCGKPYIPEAQIDWIVKTTGKDRVFFDKCPDCR